MQESPVKLILTSVLKLHLELTVNSVYNVQIKYTLQGNTGVKKSLRFNKKEAAVYVKDLFRSLLDDYGFV